MTPGARAGRQLGSLGALGIALLLVGTFAPGVSPGVDASVVGWTRYFEDHRTAILIGAALTVTAVPLLFALLAGAAPLGTSPLAPLAIGAWAFAFSFLTVSVALTAAIAWRGPDALDESTVRFAVDVAHLALWGLSAGPTAVAVVATTVVVASVRPLPAWLIVLAGLKVATCVVEVAGLGVASGWNAGGYASFAGGVALVAWLAGLALAGFPDPMKDRPQRQWAHMEGDRA